VCLGVNDDDAAADDKEEDESDGLLHDSVMSINAFNFPLDLLLDSPVA
jgi:hypothetical protein